MTGNDGCWSLPFITVINFPEPCIDWTALGLALFGVDEPATVEKMTVRLLHMVRFMPEEDFAFIAAAWTRYQSRQWDTLCYTERAAIGRVCRRIVREAKESKERE